MTTSPPLCPHCRAALQPAATFCSSCGKPVAPPPKPQSGWSLLSFGALGFLLLVGLGVAFLAVMPKIAKTPTQAAAPAPSTAVISRPAAPSATVTGKFETRARVGGALPWTFTVQNDGEQPIDGFAAILTEDIKAYTITGCVPKCVHSTSNLLGSRTTFTFADAIAPGETKSYRINLSPNEPGNVKLLWLFYDAQRHELLGPDGKSHTLSGEVAIVR